MAPLSAPARTPVRAARVLGLLLALVSSGAFSAELPSEVKQALASRDYDGAVVWLKANAQDPEAAFELGRLYRLGKGVPEDPTQALTLFHNAAQAGHPNAQYLLGKHFEKTGELDTAVYWMQLAAAEGHRQASAWTAPIVALKEQDLSAMIRTRRSPPASAPRELINQPDGTGRTPLMVAAGAGERAWLEFLIAEQAKLNVADRHGVTALQQAVMAGQDDAVRLLLEAGAEPDTINNEGNTALHLAVANGFPVIVDLLLRANAASDLANDAGWSAEALVVRSGDAAMMHRFGIPADGAQRMLVVEDAPAFRALLVDAALRGNEARVDELLQREEFDASAAEFQQLLFELCTESSAPILKRLVAAGVSVDNRNPRGQPVLLVAAGAGCLPCVETLQKAGAALEAADGQGRTSLMHAARTGHDPIVLLLLQAGAQIDRTDDLARNALWWSVRDKQWPAAELLLVQGADVTADANGLNPLHLAAEADGVSVLAAFAAQVPVDQPTADGNSALLIAAHAGSAEAVGELLRMDADVHFRNALGDTALIVAARQSHLAVARLLLDAGADPRARNDRFESAVSIATTRGEAEWLELLESAERSVLDLLGAR